MNVIKKYVIPFLWPILITLVLLVPVTIFYYFNITSDKITGALLWIVSAISIFIGSFKFSKEMKYKGIISGVIYYLGLLSFIVILSLIIFKVHFNLQSLVYYLAMLLFSIIGGILGKNIKTDED